MAEQPNSPQQLLEFVRDAKGPILPVGGGSKPACSGIRQNFDTSVSTTKLSGILEYQPSEFTFTALANTPLAEINAELEKNGQYLPFDPPLIDAGATLAGTLAAGLSGPGAYRYGTVRDFVLGIEYIDGRAEHLLRAGGKVVKNAAGWDLPKFFNGSLGRFGILTELTFKVFPCPPAAATVTWDVDSIDAGVDLLRALSRGPWDLDALELDAKVAVRLRGQPEAADARIARLLEAHPGGKRDDDSEIWNQRREFGWADGKAALIKVPVTPNQVSDLDNALSAVGAERVYSVGANVAWIAHDDAAQIESLLADRNLTGLAIRGSDRPLIGAPQQLQVISSLKESLDPNGRFPSVNAH